jgi:hypothetical protein
MHQRALGKCAPRAGLSHMFEGWIGVFVIFGIFAFASDLILWLVGFWYWVWDKHRGLNRVTYETTVIARCPCHPHLEGRGQSKIQAMRKLEAVVKLGNATEKAS